MKHKYITAWMILSLLIWAGSVSAKTGYCFGQAADYYQVPEILIKAIAKHESGMNPNDVSINKNGSRDIGLMQINEWWLPKIKTMGIREEDLFDPCVSIFVGTWVLAENMQRTDDIWEAVGAYNAGWRKGKLRDERRRKYIDRIKKEIEALKKKEQS